jgi:capsular polysaccharide biosynthesis protein
MEEQPLDLRGAFKAVRMHRLMVALVAVVGLGAGIAYGVKTPPRPEARSLVLLPPSAFTGNPGVSPYTKTQEIIVTSTRVLSAAGSSVAPPVGAARLRRDITVTAPSQDVLQVSVSAQTLGEAERLANAVATSYVAYVAGTANGSQQLLAQLQQEAAKLTHQILGLQHQINVTQSRLAAEKATSPAGQRVAPLLSALRTQQQQLSIQLNNVNTQVANAEVTTAQASSATQVLQRAEPVGASKARVPLIALLGALAGLVAGCVAAIALARGDHRLRSRDAIAAALGVPVVASMWAKRCKSANDWRWLLEQSKNPSPMEAWNVRRVVHRLMAAGGPTEVKMRLIAFSGDEPAAAAVVKMAGAAAALGATSQLELGPQPALAVLRAMCVVTQGPASGSASLDLKAGSATSTELAGLQVMVTLEVIDAGKPKVAASPATTLLVVSSGFATGAELARAALAASDSGSPLSAVVATNPDPDDSTAGLVPEPGGFLQVAPPSFNGHVSVELAREEPK